MATHPAWHLPFAFVAGGVIQLVILIACYPAIHRLSNFLVLDLGREQWFVAALWVSAICVMLGLAIASSRLETAGRGALAGLCAVVALFGTIGIFALGFLAMLFASDERVELAVPDGRSIVVTQFCWHHCSLWVTQRDGIFIDNGLATAGDTDRHYSFDDGSYTLEQHGDRVIVHTPQGEFAVFLE